MTNAEIKKFFEENPKVKKFRVYYKDGRKSNVRRLFSNPFTIDICEKHKYSRNYGAILSKEELDNWKEIRLIKTRKE